MKREEFIEKLSAAKSVSEILDLARANGVELPEDKAKELYALINGENELSDDMLEAVSGGGRTRTRSRPSSSGSERSVGDDILDFLGDWLSVSFVGRRF